MRLAAAPYDAGRQLQRPVPLCTAASLEEPQAQQKGAQALHIRRRQAPHQPAGLVGRAGQGGGQGATQAGAGAIVHSEVHWASVRAEARLARKLGTSWRAMLVDASHMSASTAPAGPGAASKAATVSPSGEGG